MLIGQDPAGPEQHWHRLYNAWRWRGGAVSHDRAGRASTSRCGISRASAWACRSRGCSAARTAPSCAAMPATGCSGADDARTGAYEGAQEAVRRGFTAFKCRPFTCRGLRQQRGGRDRAGRRADGGGARGRGPGCRDLHRVQRVPLAAHGGAAGPRRSRPTGPAGSRSRSRSRMRRRWRSCSARSARRSRPASDCCRASSTARCSREGGCRIIQPDLMHAGGFTEVTQASRALADTYYIPVAPHNPGGPICTRGRHASRRRRSRIPDPGADGAAARACATRASDPSDPLRGRAFPPARGAGPRHRAESRRSCRQSASSRSRAPNATGSLFR